MCRFTWILPVALLVGLFLPSAAQAQYPGGFNIFDRPTVSPYLNLLNTNQFGVNTSYQTLVRPIEDARQASSANRADINRLQRQLGGGGRGPGVAGASTHFMNYSHYYRGIR